MKEKLIYTLLGEGYAEYAFLETYLKRVFEIEKPNIQLVSSRQMKPSGGKSSSSVILSKIKDHYITSFINRNDVKLFIAGIDLDESDFEDNMPKYNAKIEEMKNKLGNLYSKFEDKTILFVPIQAIDYWILYQQKSENKISNNSIESRNKDEIKTRLYGDSNANQIKIEKISLKIATKANFEELAKQSKSFKLFHNQVKSFIETL
ncbi:MULTISPECIES: hypothetical protein [unclassified Arcicella]|uniref:hypothetical protein n=1 Tax=unclassified Arcicella TaxID=2644986 RepID=UPI0028679881|nr:MULTISPECIES: hypothetical protein [unclassified Arcicella]MDR6561065.1 hypothetical protein [Arcicella sp. BE51]MDR6810949.1 hypothetical protein [Arcicella sp. BE140]MDR6822299.1 hypothetical protein [Arcicella sp. BE139]